MRATEKRRRRSGSALLTGTVLVLLAGCGGGDFKDKSRPPVSLTLTGVIQKDKVTVSPNRFGSGPIEITLSNQTKEAHTVTLEGDRVRERVGPINPLDTATIQATLDPGTYEVRAGSDVAMPREITPATLDVGQKRSDSNNRLLLP